MTENDRPGSGKTASIGKRPGRISIGDPYPRDDIDQWCRLMWAGMKEGGRWGIPRSGLIFAKQEGRLVLVDSMPHMDGMPITVDQLLQQQQSDFNATVDRFGRVGVEVVDARSTSFK